jgi:Pyridoxal-dependent decarboxylase conserved domain
VYCSDQAHSSIDKAVMTIGLGHEALRKIDVDADYRMRAEALRDAIVEDRSNGLLPIAVVATVGTTSTTSIDPVPAIAEICERERLWLHVDAAYAGVAAMLPSHAHIHAAAGPHRAANRDWSSGDHRAARPARLGLAGRACRHACASLRTMNKAPLRSPHENTWRSLMSGLRNRCPPSSFPALRGSAFLKTEARSGPA